MRVSRRRVGLGVTIRGEDEQFILRPRRIEWYEPSVVFMLQEEHRSEEQRAVLGQEVSIRADIVLVVLKIGWSVQDNMPTQVVEFGLTAPQGTTFLDPELRPWTREEVLTPR